MAWCTFSHLSGLFLQWGKIAVRSEWECQGMLIPLRFGRMLLPTGFLWFCTRHALARRHKEFHRRGIGYRLIFSGGMSKPHFVELGDIHASLSSCAETFSRLLPWCSPKIFRRSSPALPHIDNTFSVPKHLVLWNDVATSQMSAWATFIVMRSSDLERLTYICGAPRKRTLETSALSCSRLWHRHLRMTDVLLA